MANLTQSATSGSAINRIAAIPRWRVVLLILAVLLWAGGAAAAWARPDKAVLTEQRINVKGVERIYYLYIPRQSPAKNRPLVLAFHGGQGNGRKLARQTGLNRVAEQHGFLVVYPNSRKYWNDGRATTGTAKNDIFFVTMLIDSLVETQRVDRRRVYATGASNGGMFTLRLACEMADEIAAFAPVIASFPVAYQSRCRPGRAVPIMLINGTKDIFIPWQGGQILKGRRRGAGGEVIPVPDTAKFWARHNGCALDTTVQSLPDSDPDDGTTVQLISYSECNNSGAVRLVKVQGGGHAWPGSPLRLPPRRARLIGNISRDIDGSETIWEFFRQHRLP